MLWLFAAASLWATEELTTLVVELKGGTNLHCILNVQYPRVTLNGDGLGITFHEITYPDPANPDPEVGAVSPETSTITYQVEQVEKFHFGKMSFNAIETPVAEKSAIRIKQMDGQTVTISGTEATDRISLYTTDGRMVQSAVSEENGETSISIGSLEKGIYILQINEKVSFKILKQ